jgi:hypothetical protein
MVFVAGMGDFGKVQKVAHFSRSPRLPTDMRKSSRIGGAQFVGWVERSDTHRSTVTN